MAIQARSKSDLCSGSMFLVVGGGAILLSSDYDLGTVTQMGPGFFPMCIGFLLVLLGIVAVVRGFLVWSNDEAIPRSIAPAAQIVIGVLGFSFLVDRAGLVAAIFCLVVFSCLGRVRKRPVEVALIFLILASASVTIFIYGFGMPLRAF